MSATPSRTPPPRGLASTLLANFEEVISGAALVIVVLSVCWGVVSRYVTEQPATWSGEVAAIAFAWVVFLGASAGFKRGMHVSIDMLMLRVPAIIRIPVERLLDVAVFLFCLYVAWLGVGFTLDNWDNPTSVLRLPLSIVYVAVTLGFALMALRYAEAAMTRWRGERQGG
jgi:TRAP-type C4-dicarboxylate transport system permease small subunit